MIRFGVNVGLYERTKKDGKILGVACALTLVIVVLEAGFSDGIYYNRVLFPMAGESFSSGYTCEPSKLLWKKWGKGKGRK